MRVNVNQLTNKKKAFTTRSHCSKKTQSLFVNFKRKKRSYRSPFTNEWGTARGFRNERTDVPGGRSVPDRSKNISILYPPRTRGENRSAIAFKSIQMYLQFLQAVVAQGRLAVRSVRRDPGLTVFTGRHRVTPF